MQFLSLYLHIPFCQQRCSYCAFNIYTKQHALIIPYIEALCQEVALIGHGQAVHTIYIGGGTPSLLPLSQVAQIFQALSQAFDLSPLREVTFEVNPSQHDLGYLRALRSLAINRLSIGMQSRHAHELALFGRDHQHDDTAKLIENARRARFDNLSLDLIYGSPGQTLADWQASLESALDFAPSHFSLYALQLEAGTALTRQIKKGLLSRPNDDLSADMYDWAVERLAQAGYEHYEISSWAKTGYQSQHNLQYWHHRPYAGLGAGAHGYLENIRTVNVMRPEVYMKRMTSPKQYLYPLTPVTQQHEVISQPDQRFERVMLGLRLLQEGLSKAEYQAYFGESIHQRYGLVIDQLKQQGLLLEQADRFLLPRHTWLTANRVLHEFILEEDE
jgi:oxygen-independent coproporphyrinogen-3 oxidase